MPEPRDIPLAIAIALLLLAAVVKAVDLLSKKNHNDHKPVNGSAGSQTTDYWERKNMIIFTTVIKSELLPILAQQTSILQQIAITQARLVDEMAKLNTQMAVFAAVQAEREIARIRHDS